MGDAWIGRAISIQCDDKLGVFQGTIKDVSSTQITIIRAFRNGVPLRKQDAEVTLSASDIVKLEFLPTYNAQSTVAPNVVNMPTPKKQLNFGAFSKESTLTNKISNMKISNGQRRSPTFEKFPKPPTTNKSPSNATKCFGNLIPPKVEIKLGASLTNNYENGISSSSKPIDICKSLPNGRSKQDRKKARREAKQIQTFGTPVDDPMMNEEFDFEGNLALFNKQALWDLIESEKKPDLVRQAVSAHRNQYRHDENILASEPLEFRQIESFFKGSTEFVTDEGLIIPTVPTMVRSKIQMLAEKNGLSWNRQVDILARGACDLAILLLGGARRMNPKNSHQWPTIAIICDKPHSARVSEIGAATGRILASHGLKVMLYVEKDISDKGNTELELFRSTGNVVVHSLNSLPSPDLVILSISSNNLSPSIKTWLMDNRSSILAIDPPTSGIQDVPIKCSIVPILPLNNISTACGKLYLCNIGIPDKFYRDAGIKYKSPFGHKFVIPIHKLD